MGCVAFFCITRIRFSALKDLILNCDLEWLDSALADKYSSIHFQGLCSHKWLHFWKLHYFDFLACTIILGAFIHKKDRDLHRDWNTEIFLRLFRQAEISRWSPSGMILVTELRMPDIKHCPCFDTLAWNDGIENTKIICSSVHTSAAMQIIALIPK